MSEQNGQNPDTGTREFQTLAEFYPYYLTEHSNQTCRRLHYFGSTLVLLTLGYALVTQQFWMLLLLPLFGYGPAWTGHFFFEHNKPATFKYPLYSFLSDWIMLKDMLTGKIRF